MVRVALVWKCALLSWPAASMRIDRLGELRQETVDMFYHGYNNYMKHAFPEDEVRASAEKKPEPSFKRIHGLTLTFSCLSHQLRPLTCGALTRDRNDPTRIELNDALGNYSLTLIDSLSTLAILAGGPKDGTHTGPQALSDFQDGVAHFIHHYGDGRPGPSGQGLRARGFDLDSKVQVFETVIRGLGGLLSAHLFAIGELPITGYDPKASTGESASDDPLQSAPIAWPNGLKYDGQLLRLALDLAERLLPAFYTKTGIPYPRVNLRTGIPFYVNSPLNGGLDSSGAIPEERLEITETCSAGAGSLTLEFTVLSRLTGDPRFEHAAKRAFWEVWRRRSEIGLIGNGIDAERGFWIGPHSGIGAGMDSFFEYAFKSHVLLSGQDMPNATTSRKQSTTNWLDPNSLHDPLPREMHSSDAFLQTWHEAHASVKRHIYTDRSHFPYYSNSHRATGQPYTMWIDSLGAFYPGLLALAGEVDEAIEANLVYTALWTRYSALPERWSIRESNVEPGIGWWPGRPEFIESTYHIYRATKDPWYLHVGEMVLKDIRRRCYAPCGWAGLQDVRTGEKQNRMESFFLGETAKYMYLLFDADHPLNKLDAAYVFTTEGHPLVIPVKKHERRTRRSRGTTTGGKASAGQSHERSVSVSHVDRNFTNTCPAPPRSDLLLTGSFTAARRDLFGVSRFTNLYNTPNMHGPLQEVLVHEENKGLVTKYRAVSNHTLFPWTLPPTMLPPDGMCAAPPQRIISAIEFPAADAASSLMSRFGASLDWLSYLGPTVKSLEGLRLQLEREFSQRYGEHVWKITHVGNTQLGRHETVFFHAEHVRHLRDEAFTALRRKDVVDIQLLVETSFPTNASASSASSSSYPTSPFSDDPLAPEHTSSSPSVLVGSSQHNNQQQGSLNNVLQSESLFQHILRAVTSVFDPSETTAPGDDDDAATSSSSRDGNSSNRPPLLFYSWQALTSIGAGSSPVPTILDTPSPHSPSYDPSDPVANFPWTSIYFADTACAGPLPESIPRDHQVLILRRGGCSFSDKIRNIPGFVPRKSALQLVIVVDDPVSNTRTTGQRQQQQRGSGKEQQQEEEELPRPLLESEQLTPNGITRVHGVPLVLMRVGRGEYSLFERAVGVGMRRKYTIQSQGHIIENAVVL
ncbi:Glycoside hydrolase, family 47 [Moelleriella libera RCEF 2490]|uniref:Glycoside hydrolase, family 47 n=1 Tax=Moelleriella libera RCEF 2490 TaxID=1081109 RepID=A0A166U568_9HYPO|nr:Glycoside hydrolase, family 47 [Moelleriella libera RCEF 2490]